jgi:ribosomal protein S26
MKASELLSKLNEGEAIPCDNCDGTIPDDEMMRFAFKLGELAPRMENANVGSITCVQCQVDDPDIKITPRGPDVKFTRGD